MDEGKVHTVLRLGNPKQRDNLEELGVDGRVIVEYVFKKLVARA
jgi:hypothetical protein